MIPFRKILCPVDFSSPSIEALRAARDLAEKNSAELILIHVVQPVQPVAPPGVPAGYAIQGYYEERAAAAWKSLDQLVKNEMPERLKVRAKVVLGQAADEIVKAAESEKVDVIVASTHGWTGWRRFVFGSVAEKVVRLSSCPVLIIPGPGGRDREKSPQ